MNHQTSEFSKLDSECQNESKLIKKRESIGFVGPCGEININDGFFHWQRALFKKLYVNTRTNFLTWARRDIRHWSRNRASTPCAFRKIISISSRIHSMTWWTSLFYQRDDLYHSIQCQPNESNTHLCFLLRSLCYRIEYQKPNKLSTSRGNRHSGTLILPYSARSTVIEHSCVVRSLLISPWIKKTIETNLKKNDIAIDTLTYRYRYPL